MVSHDDMSRLTSALDERVEVMPSLQRPKRLVFIGTDGRRYPFLCKPHDDLRKDARLMDFNSMINKLLKSASESRRRQLCESVHRVDLIKHRHTHLRGDAVE